MADDKPDEHGADLSGEDSVCASGEVADEDVDSVAGGEAWAGSLVPLPPLPPIPPLPG